MKAAMKAGEKERLGTLRLLRSELQNATIAKGEALTEDEAMSVLQRQAKQRRDAIAAFEEGGRDDLVASEQQELKIIEGYLPAQMTDEEIEAGVRDAIERTGASDMSDMGQVMGVLMDELQGRAAGKRVSAVVRRLLSQ